MAEYIDREKLLKRFNIDDMMNVNGTLISLRDAREIISSFPAVSVQQWISVKDGMPEDNDRVIAFRPYEAEVSAYRYSVMWGWALKTSVSHRGITHWMPLPEPPKGENDG